NNVKFYPEGGCPGPVEVQLGPDVVLVIVDSQWWIHPYDKPGIESDCPYKTKDEVIAQIGDILVKNFNKLVIFATHHPFRSNGVHGGFFGIKQHVFPFTDLSKNLYIPLPVIGSIYPIARGVFGTPQDMKHPAYQNMIRDLSEATKSHPNLIYAAGHEHNLQLIKDTGHYYIVSGSGYNSSRVNKSKKSHFVSPEHGFALLEVSKNKNVRISFYVTDVDSTKMAYTENIIDFSKLPELPKDTTKPVSEWKDHVLVAASNKYSKATGMQRFILGQNYRTDWSTPVAMRMFDITKEKGGFKILSLGGGKQTKSLKLQDKNGKEWALRTIDKDPEKAIPENLRNSVAQDIVQDLISAANPYAPLTVPILAKATGTIHATPELFFVPDDPSFGYYRPLFANTVCFLEPKDATLDGSETKSTPKVLEKMVEDNDHVVDQKAVLRARLLDMLIADYDRHWDQWRFGERDTGDGKLYYPIPKDRDQAYFFSDGLFMKYITRNRLPFLKGLKKNIPRINWLNYVARDFDRVFMNELDANDWNEVITKFQSDLTDSAVWEAMRKYPPEIYPVSGERIGKRLISRRNVLQRQGMRYYRFLSQHVNVVGSNKGEYFKVSGTDSGLHVSVYARDAQDSGFKLFDRSFVSHTTRELRLYGLNGNDIFDIDSSANSKIKIRVIGGKGNDTFQIKGGAVNYLYDLTTEQNYVEKGRRTKNYFSPKVEVNEYNRVEFKYPQNRFPRLQIGYNVEDGLFIGPGFWRQTHAFRKEPFATDQKFSALFAINRGSYQLRYLGQFNHVVRDYDLVLFGQVVDPVLNNFFGLGNNTEKKDEVPIDFYRVRFRFAEGQILVRRKLFSVLSVSAGPTFYHYWNHPENNAGKILEKPSLIGLDSMSVYKSKMYVGGKAAMLINNLNSELFPTRGIYWNTELNFLAGVTDGSGALTKINSDMIVYASMAQPAKTVAVLKVGAGHIFNKKFEYFQALTLGANNFLRGFRKDRFSGNSIFYASLELRQKLFTSKWYVIPGDVGLVLYNDLGRVWYFAERSRRWHNAYGGGLYYVPFNMVIVSATMTWSKEERLFNFSVGTKINLTF
ncbi:MAG TPA: BamA/TamA family outer membrane protein, partial [Chitinophagaceae bacterium]|nr:BamA/TamA family outer membrane protein [Chitinophagaceae bacterium]